ncbi:MAG: AAA family ATPase [Micromonosporaceae bacterium]
MTTPYGTTSLTLHARLRPAALDARRGIVRLHYEVIMALGLRPGDLVRLTGRRSTAGIVALAGPESGRGDLQADDLVLGNLGVADGAPVTVEKLRLAAARSVTVNGPDVLEGAISTQMLRLALLGKALTAGDNVSLLPQDVTPDIDRDLIAVARSSLPSIVGPAWTTVLLDVVAIDPDQALVTMDTAVTWHDETTAGPLRLADAVPGERQADQPATHVGLDDFAGMPEQAEQLRELLDLGMHHREVLERLGTSVSLGVLVTGAAGSGKSTMVRVVAESVGAAVTPLWAPEVASQDDPVAAEQLKKTFSEVRSAPRGLLLITDVEALLPKDGPRPLATWFTAVLKDALAAGVAVVATTSHPELVHPQLRGPGMLQHEIAVPMPDTEARRELLGVLTRRVRLAGDVALDRVAERTPGFVTADLLTLVREAGVRAALRHRESRAEAEPAIAAADFEGALEVVRPSSLAGSAVALDRITLDDVGDMAEVKQTLTESVLWPLSYPDSFDRLGIAAPRGVLLYGPPGCGKTYLMKALAGTGKANLISVKGAELLTKWVGESERAVRDLFQRARHAAPTLVFLDELDALAPRRGQSTDGGTTDRVVASLLTELDGVESLRDVVVVGATNRPDLIDPALLRPGRLERLVFVPPPDAEGRAAILAAAARDVPLAPDVSLTELAAELEGFSSADCAALIRQAALAAMRESLEAAEVTARHVAAARAELRPSLDPAQVEALRAYADRR